MRRERLLLDRLAYEGIVKLYFTFQDALSLYMGLEVCPNGESALTVCMSALVLLSPYGKSEGDRLCRGTQVESWCSRQPAKDGSRQGGNAGGNGWQAYMPSSKEGA